MGVFNFEKMILIIAALLYKEKAQIYGDISERVIKSKILKTDYV